MEKKTYTIGRAGDIKLKDETVSRRHACLEVEGDKLYLRDLDSHNGTYEIRDKELVPFTAGSVTQDQTFAFGECVRNVAQLLRTAELEAALASAAAKTERDGTDDPLEATQVGSAIAPRKRLTSADIIQMLDRAEDEAADGRELTDICKALGITVQRYERWCREYGATWREREQTLIALRRENERLRRLVSDLSPEPEARDDAQRTATGADGAALPRLSVVGKRNS